MKNKKVFNNKYVISINDCNNRFSPKYYSGFDGELAYDFNNHKKDALKFKSKYSARRALGHLKRNTSIDKEYEFYKIEKL